MRIFLIILALIAVAVVASNSFFTVGPTEYAYVTHFGEHIATYDGADTDSDAGLHTRWPWPVQSVQRLDRRLQHFDLPSTELPTRDPKSNRIDKMLVVEAYACWRIADREAVSTFIRKLGTTERAEAILGQRINSQLGAEIGQLSMNDLVSINSEQVEKSMQRLWQNLTTELRPALRQDYGIELVDVRLRRFYHSPQVRSSIYERIRSERSKKAEEYRSEGQKIAEDIRSQTEEEVRNILAQARYEEEKLKGQADTEAAMIRNQAHSQDPEFYVFLKKLEKLQNILGDNKTVLLLSSHRQIFDMLFQPPQPGAVPPTVITAPPAGNGSTKTSVRDSNGTGKAGEGNQ